MIWITGPPGSGKTTLISSYLEGRRIPCLWYQMDAGDKDPATFFYNLNQAVQRAFPRKRKPLPLLTPEYLISTFTRRYFEELYKRFHPPFLSPGKGGRKGGFAIVFDNYQEILPESPFHEIMVNGLANIPEGVNVFLISRSAPPSPFIRLRAN
ncbi:MAG: transcriptional activator domain, partial [Deltaproteobacteria bacterium]|nr:transcriptional activator domain [Deltaproteobacteria bacterium]